MQTELNLIYPQIPLYSDYQYSYILQDYKENLADLLLVNRGGDMWKNAYSNLEEIWKNVKEYCQQSEDLVKHI